MRFDIMTLFPTEVDAFLMSSIIGRARKAGLITVKCHDIRDFSDNKHRHVDDDPYGGGMGMVMQAKPVMECFEQIKAEVPDIYCIYLSPKGKKLTQNRAKKFLKKENITLLCGHYEGIDQRALDAVVDEEISIGDYVLTGGEIPAVVICDSVCRMIPGVLSNEECFSEESHYNGRLEYPQYTRPPVFMGREVPEVLLSGHHANIKKWREEQSEIRTRLKRPDMLKDDESE